MIKGHFAHETESPWPLHFKHSHWWKSRSQSKFAWGTNGVCECKMDVKITRIPTWHRLESCFMVPCTIFQKPPLEGRPDTKPREHGTPNAHNRWFIIFYHVWGPAWIKAHLRSMWLRAWSHMTSHYTGGSMTRLHEFGGVLGRHLDTFFWALTISWSWLLAHVWSGPKYTKYDI
jgi:hypothetical protein